MKKTTYEEASKLLLKNQEELRNQFGNQREGRSYGITFEAVIKTMVDILNAKEPKKSKAEDGTSETDDI